MKGILRGIKLLFLLSVLAAFVVAATPAAASGTSQPSLGEPTKYQGWVEKQVRHELLMLPYYSVFDNLAFRVEGDRVVLLGQVVRPSLKSDAEARVKKIEGVSSVVNQIEVLPLSPMDDRLRVRLYRAIYSQPTMTKYAIQPVPPIHIIVKGGQVTLEGVVDNAVDGNIANIRASGVPGIFSVTNNLHVES